jgi:GNAT superfamily N-acetyltransferase
MGTPVPERSDLDIRLRLMTAADIPAGLELCRAARWNQIETDWQRFLALHPAGARVAVDADDAVLGSVTTLRFDGGFDWIAMVLVAPAQRRQGIASRLVDDAIALLGTRVPARLDATPAGELVYRKLGFVPEYALARLERIPASPPEPAEAAESARSAAFAESAERAGERRVDASVRIMEDADLSEVLSFDRDVFGADRAALLRLLRQEAPGYAVVAADRQGSRLDGYAFGRHGFSFDQLGPIIARDERTARRLIGHLLASHPRIPFLVDVPRRSTTWTSWLGDVGFREQRGFVRLVRGAPADVASTCSEQLFATVGADFG